MRYAFDLDGTLVDTRPIIREAYVHAGVTPPDDFFGKTFREWFPGSDPDAQRIHAEKQAYYKQHAHRVRPLPLMSLLQTLAMSGHNPMILTGASYNSVQILENRFAILGRVEVLASLTAEAKARVLNEAETPGIMFEDDKRIAQYLGDNTRWTICCIS